MSDTPIKYEFREAVNRALYETPFGPRLAQKFYYTAAILEAVSALLPDAERRQLHGLAAWYHEKGDYELEDEWPK